MVVPKNAPPVQVTETRQAFYAGYRGMYGDSLQAAELDEDEAVKIFERINVELEKYLSDHKKKHGL